MDSPDERRWFHVIITMYAAWLPGDPRGFRTWHHRLHVEGDYKTPPAAGQYEELTGHMQRKLQYAPAALAVDQRQSVGEAFLEKLEQLTAVVACLAVGRRHSHLLVKLPPGQTRNWIGLAKKHAWFELRAKTGQAKKLWAKRPKFLPIRNRAHQLNVYRYILRHAREGAYIWRYADRKP